MLPYNPSTIYIILVLVAVAPARAAVHQWSPASDLTKLPALRPGDVVKWASGTTPFITGTADSRFVSIDAPESAIVACNDVLWGSVRLSTTTADRGPVTGSNNWILRGGQLPKGGDFKITDRSSWRDLALRGGDPRTDRGVLAVGSKVDVKHTRKKQRESRA